jgi:FkbM family methyltransferase
MTPQRSKKVRDYIYGLSYRLLLRFAGRRDHFGAAIGHLLYGLHNCLLRTVAPDSTVVLKANGADLEFPAGHLLPLYLAQYPLQESPLFDLAKAVQRRHPEKPFLMVDVGANIGDTAILTALQVPGRYLCIEGSERYYSLLQRNVARHKLGERFLTHRCFCGEPANFDQHLSSNEAFGSAQAKPTIAPAKQEAGNVKCLDDLLREDGVLEKVSLLKVDTDGFDYRVLRGAKECLGRSKPPIFLELSPPSLLDQGEEPMAIFPWLRQCGYASWIIYTNFGELLTYGSLENQEEILKLVNYNLRYRRFHYDIVLLAPADHDLFLELVTPQANSSGKSMP